MAVLTKLEVFHYLAIDSAAVVRYAMNLSKPQYWKKRGVKSYLLLPVSLLFQLLSSIRAVAFRTGLVSSWRCPVPVVIVGNITVGGAGKSPLVIALTELLLQREYKVGIVSRGYGGSNVAKPVVVTAESDPSLVGDECVMIAARTGVPLVACANRVQAVQHLLSVAKPDIVISDDGMQHYRLQRDLEIVVVDTAYRFGNGFCLPAGPLRESVRRLKSVDMVVHNGEDRQEPGFELQGNQAINIRDANDRVAITSFCPGPVHAVAGIASPERFFSFLRAQGLQLIEHPFPDHVNYHPDDLVFDSNLPVLLTEKDYVKLSRYDLENCWTIPVSAMLDEKIKEEFMMLADQLISQNATSIGPKGSSKTGNI